MLSSCVASKIRSIQPESGIKEPYLSPNPPKEGVGLASRGGKKVLLCFWDNGFVAKKRPRKRSTR